ncbi:signal peptidase I [Gloeomargarita lithophora]|uniref:signal peptidase I n=1 Tax=Gloeomargarita lithophora TaxID=1188228 RepID=UPI0008F879BB
MDKNHRDKSEKQASENSLVEWVKTIGVSLLLAFGIRTFVAEARYIPSESMLPTLQVNDRLIIDKVTYDFRTPERGEIVVFQPTSALKEQGFKDAFIKRIVGLPGDQVAVKKGTVYVNGQPLQENYLAGPPDYEYGPVVVPPDSYLVLGDNRNHSFDSHFWGFVPRQNIIGRAAVRFWPPNRIGGIPSP